MYPLGYAPRGLPILACVLLAVHAGGVLGTLCTPLGGLPVLACVQVAVSRWGVLCTLGHVPTFPVPYSYPACALLAVSRWRFWVCLYIPLEGLPALLYVQIAVSAGGCCARWDTPLEGLPVLACVLLAVHAGGCCTRLDTPLGGSPSLPCVLLSVSRWGVWCSMGYVPRRLPPHSPALRPSRLHFLQLCHLVIQSTRTTTFCRPKKHPLKWSLGTPF